MKKSIFISIVILNIISIAMSIYWFVIVFGESTATPHHNEKRVPPPVAKTEKEKAIESHYKNQIYEWVTNAMDAHRNKKSLRKRITQSHIFISLSWLILSLISGFVLYKNKNSNKRMLPDGVPPPGDA
jgi:hypothetical protein